MGIKSYSLILFLTADFTIFSLLNLFNLFFISCNLNFQRINLYQVKLDLAKQLTKGSRIIKINELFSQKTIDNAWREYLSYTSNPKKK